MDLSEGLVQGSADAAFAIDSRQKIVAWNDRATDVTGFSRQEVVGKPCYQVLGTTLLDDRPVCTPDCSAMRCFRLFQPFRLDSATFVRRDGQRLAVSLTTLTLSHDLRQIGVIAVVFLRPLVGPDSHQTPVMQVFMLGRFRALVDGRELQPNAWKRRQALTLFKLLLHYRKHPVHRDKLIEDLWPEATADKGTRHLKVLIHALRNTLEPARGAAEQSRFIVRVHDSYMVSPEVTWVDADRFEELVTHASTLERVGAHSSALAIYKEALRLHGGGYLEEDAYGDWCASERNRLQDLFLQASDRAASICATVGDYHQAIQLAYRALAADAYRESAYAQLMTFLWRAGRPREAVQLFQTCVAMLQRESAVAPSLETRDLYSKIVQDCAGLAADSGR